MASPHPVNDPQEESLAGPAARDANRRQSRMTLPAFNHPSRYLLTSYQKDAMILRQIILGTIQGSYQDLAPLILDFDDLTCHVLYKTMCSDKKRRDEFVQQAETLLDQPGNLTTSEDAFQRFLYRFREGPSQEEGDIPEEEPLPSQSGRDDLRYPHLPSARGTDDPRAPTPL